MKKTYPFLISIVNKYPQQGLSLHWFLGGNLTLSFISYADHSYHIKNKQHFTIKRHWKSSIEDKATKPICHMYRNQYICSVELMFGALHSGMTIPSDMCSHLIVYLLDSEHITKLFRTKKSDFLIHDLFDLFSKSNLTLLWGHFFSFLPHGSLNLLFLNIWSWYRSHTLPPCPCVALLIL